MLAVVGVRFREAGKIYYFDPGDLNIRRDDPVIVETVRGVEYGMIVSGIRYVTEDEVVLPLKSVIRVATADDVEQMKRNRQAAKDALKLCGEKVSQHGLEMKLVDAEYTFDRNKIIFYFTADGRVDFRELVRDLASVFRTRIELRQIGVRDEAKMLGGIGPCGRVLCCSSFLGDFEPVSIKMAKDQNLSLNPAKISGLCGRLMCCLKYENDTYVEAKKKMPDVGMKVTTPEGDGRVVLLNLLERRVQVELVDSGRTVEHSADEVTALV
ncbi:PSP1 domain-containing protein [Desmospora activa]|uniref:Cell fate regulator YaaT (PSP1 superfamily) n=1 Tax=Desmospora activa DSM 45169 TaxID=1121389 RepID=A0A2T4Z233_9BACL|nr:stage 0 sporulation family protein [Desmospora activa]PTM54846.1 cell fate regulator YaaT (PSP1 superfamily) [Desmospora activa DSM 45169]